MRNGFTLLELMIVVAIIGILATVAIPALRQYVKQSKTSEAVMNIENIQKGATSFFQEEHYDRTGMSARTHVYPYASNVEGIGEEADDSTIGRGFSPLDYKERFKTAPWLQLKFVIDSSFLFYYIYDSTDDNQSTFQASASASLSEECDSIYIVNGNPDGTMSAIINADDDLSKCNVATAP